MKTKTKQSAFLLRNLGLGIAVAMSVAACGQTDPEQDQIVIYCRNVAYYAPTLEEVSIKSANSSFFLLLQRFVLVVRSSIFLTYRCKV